MLHCCLMLSVPLSVPVMVVMNAPSSSPHRRRPLTLLPNHPPTAFVCGQPKPVTQSPMLGSPFQPQYIDMATRSKGTFLDGGDNKREDTRKTHKIGGRAFSPLSQREKEEKERRRARTPTTTRDDDDLDHTNFARAAMHIARNKCHLNECLSSASHKTHTKQH